MKNLLICICFILAACSLHGQRPYWQQELHYTIDVQLNDTSHSIDGFLKLKYINHSPDTLNFIWFHLWPNAYKNDRTAFNEQLLQNGRTDFYFSDKSKRGYINRLDFRTDNEGLKTEDHQQYIDVVKVWLSKPLLPGSQTEITTPFHVQLPHNFSRGGHVDQSYQLTQWYPKPAVYDQWGWHPMPYLDQGEFYGEFGSYDVRITLPDNYVVAATGELQDTPEKNWLTNGANNQLIETGYRQWEEKRKAAIKKAKPGAKKNTGSYNIPSSNATKTVRYKQDKVHDFAWFADKLFMVKWDTLQLPSGKSIEAFSFYAYSDRDIWKNSVNFIKDAIRFRSSLIGEYPYATVSVVEAKIGFNGGMEYPTITSISTMKDEKSLDMVIEHEVGHNWFYGILANNERAHPWLDEGINSYYDRRYEKLKYGTEADQDYFARKFPKEEADLMIAAVEGEHKDQPIATSSENFTELNYGVIAYAKTANWLAMVEKELGVAKFDECMQAYYRQWQFRHPGPDDFRMALEKGSGKDLGAMFSQLQAKGPLTPAPAHKKIKPAFLFNYSNSDSITYINFLPVFGYNKYDGLMAGAAIHNFNIPANRFQFLVTPMYAFGSKQVNVIGAAVYTWHTRGIFEKIQFGANGSRFSSLKGTDSNQVKIFGGFYKVVPTLRFVFSNKNPRSTREKWIEWRTYFIGERTFDYYLKSSDSIYYPSEGALTNRYLNQLTYSITDYRSLYPFDAQLQLQQGEGFYRATATGQTFLNYAKGGGALVRFFAAKFGYLGSKTSEKTFDTYVYQPKLTAVRGNEDYTYGNYFFGRNENDGFESQQIMMRDGGLKLRTDLFQDLQGRSDNWVASINLNTSIPATILPRFIPLKIFLDIGTYADAWKDDATTSRFLFVGGLQLSFLKDLVNIYLPVFYSKDFSDNLKTVPEENKFIRKISFSIDVQRFNLRRLSGNKLPF